MDFLKRVLSTVIGIIVFLTITFFFMFIVGVFIGKSTDKTKVSKNSILEINLDFPLMDNAGKVRYKNLSFLNEDNKNGLLYLVNAIDHAAEDENIKGISIEKPATKAGITQLKNIREALERFKEAGKFVSAYADIYTQKDYYLSSVADSIFISPVGHLDFKGLSSELLYTKDLQEKSGIKMDVVRVGKYKSAVEPFLDNEISAENKEQILSYLNSIWKDLRQEIGASRNIEADQLDTIADQLLARTPERALETGLADKIAYFSTYENTLKEKLDLKEKDKLNRIDLLDYTERIGRQNKYKTNKNKIAVVYAQGQIIYDEGSIETVSPDDMNKSLQKAQKDDAVKAVVLRVNSPGGDAMSSDLIWNEIENTKKEKPVIVSMGDVAASGGYYIAAGGDKIFAEPSTITGSIGVFGMLPNIKELADDMGVTAQQVSTNDNAIAYSPFTDMTDSQRGFLEENVSAIYGLFKQRVADGRGLSLDEVEEIAQGRVWTGSQAIENGLVDELGGLEEALAYAAEQADIDDYQIKEYPVFEVDFDKLFRRLGMGMSVEEITKEALGEELYPAYENLKNKLNHKGVQLLFPYSTEIK